MELLDRYVLGTYARLPVAFVHGKGAWLWDADGKKYLDFFSGLAVAGLGHADPRIAGIIADQAKHLLHCSNVFYIQEQAELAKVLAGKSGLPKAFFCNSGAEAVESAIKFSRYSGIKKSGPDRFGIIVAKNSFHGRTMGALSATMQAKYQSGFGPMLPGFTAVPFDDARAVEKKIDGNTCAVLMETIQGEGGVRIPSRNYFSDLRKLCDEKNVLLVLDEVQAGMGRTGRLFAYEHFGVKPDILCLSKALGSGIPIGACLVSEEISGEVVPGIHASTFGGNPFACRVALETVSRLSKPSFLLKVRQNGCFFQKELAGLKRRYPLISEVRGLGLMIACELHEERGVEIVKKCLERGLLINSIHGKVLRFVPPLIIGPAEVKKATGILGDVLKNLE